MSEAMNRRDILFSVSGFAAGAGIGFLAYKSFMNRYTRALLPPNESISYTETWCDPLSAIHINDGLPPNLRVPEDQVRIINAIRARRCEVVLGSHSEFNNRILDGNLNFMGEFSDIDLSGTQFENWLGYFNMVSATPRIELPVFTRGGSARISTIVLSGSRLSAEEMAASEMKHIVFGSVVRFSGSFQGSYNKKNPWQAEYQVRFTNVRALERT